MHIYVFVELYSIIAHILPGAIGGPPYFAMRDMRCMLCSVNPPISSPAEWRFTTSQLARARPSSVWKQLARPSSVRRQLARAEDRASIADALGSAIPAGAWTDEYRNKVNL